MADLGMQSETTVDTDLPEGYTATELGPLPEDWEAARLEKVIEFTRKPRSLRISDLSEIPFIPMESIPAGGTSGCGFILKSGDSISSGTYCEPGDILLAKITPSLENGKQGVVPTELPDGLAMATTEVFPLKPKPDLLDRSFLFFYLLYGPVRRDLASKMEGSTGRQRLPKHVLSNLLVPLPRLPEQEDIAHVLRTIQEAKEATEQVIVATQELKSSLMNHLFTYGPVPVDEAEQVPLRETEIGPVPEHWRVTKLEKVCDRFQYGTSQRCDANAEGNPVLRIPNVIGSRVSTDDLKYTRLPEKVTNNLKLSAGDLLFVRTNGRREYVGRCAIFQGEPAEALFASYLIRAQLDESVLLPEFFRFFATTPAGRSWLSGRASEAADGKYNLNIQILKDVSVPLPPLNEQQRVVAMLETVESKIATETKRKQSLDVLFRTLLHNLMTGEVRVNDLDLSVVEEMV